MNDSVLAMNRRIIQTMSPGLSFKSPSNKKPNMYLYVYSHLMAFLQLFNNKIDSLYNYWHSNSIFSLLFVLIKLFVYFIFYLIIYIYLKISTTIEIWIMQPRISILVNINSLGKKFIIICLWMQMQRAPE